MFMIVSVYAVLAGLVGCEAQGRVVGAGRYADMGRCTARYANAYAVVYVYR